MHDSLQEALNVLDALRTRVDGNEGRPSAEAICVELTHVMALIVEHQQAAIVVVEPDGQVHTEPEPVEAQQPAYAEEVVDETPIAAADADAAFADAAPDAR